MPEHLIGWIRPAAFVLAGLLVGLFADRVIVGRLRKYAEEKDSHLWRAVTNVIGHAPVIWFFAFGISLALLNLPVVIPPRTEHWINNALFVGVSLSIIVVVARAVTAVTALYTQRFQGVFPSTSIFANLVRLAVYLLGGLIILQSLGISITPILTALGVGGLAVALALQDTLSNLFSGLQILASGQFRPGDYIKLSSGEEGYVRDITWRNTTVQTLSSFTHVLPNSKLAGAIVTNYHVPANEMSLVVPCSVAYGSDLDRVEEVTVETARQIMTEVDGGVPEYDPLVRYTGFGDSGITFNIVVRVAEFGNQFLIRSELIRRLHKRYQQEGISIPYPTRTLLFEKVPDAQPAPDPATHGTARLGASDDRRVWGTARSSDSRRG